MMLVFRASRFTFHLSRLASRAIRVVAVAGIILASVYLTLTGLLPRVPYLPQLSGTYKPPIVPLKLTIESNGNVSLNADTGFVTPLGQFSIGGAFNLPRDPESSVAVPADPRAEIAERVDRYFAALNARDFDQAHRVCCTSAWRQRYPLAVFQKSFTNVSNLKNSPPRFLSVERDSIRIETYYNFTSSGQRKAYVLRWTLVREGDAWLASETSAIPQ